MLTLNQLFNSSDIFGSWITSFSYNFTGDTSITLVFAILFLLMFMALFKLPDVMMVLILLAPLVILSAADISMNVFVGAAILYIAFVIWSLFPGK